MIGHCGSVGLNAFVISVFVNAEPDYVAPTELRTRHWINGFMDRWIGGGWGEGVGQRPRKRALEGRAKTASMTEFGLPLQGEYFFMVRVPWAVAAPLAKRAVGRISVFVR